MTKRELFDYLNDVPDDREIYLKVDDDENCYSLEQYCVHFNNLVNTSTRGICQLAEYSNVDNAFPAIIIWV